MLKHLPNLQISHLTIVEVEKNKRISSQPTTLDVNEITSIGIREIYAVLPGISASILLGVNKKL